MSLSSLSLRILAMALMLTDHLRFALPDAGGVFFAVGRLAFPIFAFLVSEGAAHTGNIKKYLLRLLVLALVSEIPFDLMLYSTAFYPGHQNVIWTFLVSLIAVYCLRRFSGNGLICFLCAAAAALISAVCRFDYGALGVLTVLLFSFAGREDKPRLIVGFALICLAYGVLYSVWAQLFALLSLIFIFMYNGKRGKDGAALRLVFYGFYPVHMLLIHIAAG